MKNIFLVCGKSKVGKTLSIFTYLRSQMDNFLYVTYNTNFKTYNKNIPTSFYKREIFNKFNLFKSELKYIVKNNTQKNIIFEIDLEDDFSKLPIHINYFYLALENLKNLKFETYLILDKLNNTNIANHLIEQLNFTPSHINLILNYFSPLNMNINYPLLKKEYYYDFLDELIKNNIFNKKINFLLPSEKIKNIIIMPYSNIFNIIEYNISPIDYLAYMKNNPKKSSDMFLIYFENVLINEIKKIKGIQ